jgi:hypothetical protein
VRLRPSKASNPTGGSIPCKKPSLPIMGCNAGSVPLVS